MDYGGFKLDEYAPELAKSAISVLWNQLKFLWKGTRIWFLGLRKPPYEESRARQIAHAILAGHIVRAISYRNLDFPNILIAVIRRSSEQDYDATAHVLEQTGKTFRVLWQTARLFGPDAADLAVEDVDGDGHHEVIIELRSTGTGAGSRILMVYSTRKKQLFTLTESLNWQNLAGPISPEITIEPDDDPAAIRALEAAGRNRGFLQPPPPVDLDDARFAVQRWHKENGKRTSGKIRVHYYPGKPRYGSTITAECDADGIVWIAHFKGPLFGYQKSTNQHFIAYSPAWFYNWAECLAYDGERVWFGVHCKKGIMCFTPRDNSLASFEAFGDTQVPEVWALRIESETLVLNETFRVPMRPLRLRS